MQSDIREGMRQRADMTAKLDKLMEIVPFVADLQKEMDETVMPAIEEWKATKHKTVGIAMGVGAGSAVGVTSAWPALKTLVLGLMK